MKTCTITLRQNSANLIVTRTVDSDKLTEISGTLVHNINEVRLKAKKYGIGLNGFSFNRKFEIEL